jgi:hypothetical protein
MIRITEDLSSGSLVQCLVEITRMFISGALTWTLSVLCHNTDRVFVKGHERTIRVIVAKHCTRLPDDGSSVIRNMLEHF